MMNATKHPETLTVRDLIRQGCAELFQVGIDRSREECEYILMDLCRCSRAWLYLDRGKTIDIAVQERFFEMIEKRKTRIPLAYLLGETDFWKETLFVDKRCLIPRPETEILVEAVIREMRLIKKNRRAGFHLPDDSGNGRIFPEEEEAFSFLDIGTGSGVIAIALLREFPNARGILLDISDGALEVAQRNVEKYGLQDRVKLVHGDIFNFLGTWDLGLGTRSENLVRGASPEGRVSVFDLIVSNPPYLNQKDFENLQPEIEFEPRQALDGGLDGLDFYRKIIAGAKTCLTEEGFLALEVGQGQAETVSKWLQNEGYDKIHVFRDYLGIERVVTAKGMSRVTGNE